jgi:hypothetical protein
MFFGSSFSTVLSPTLSDIPFNRKSKMAAVKRKFPYLGLYLVQNINFKGCYRTVWHPDAGTCRAKLDGLPTTIKSNMAADKPEVVITTVVYLIEVRSQRLMPCIQGSSTKLIVDRHRIQAASWWNPRWPPETGSSNNFACIIDRNAISNANTLLSMVANTTERRPTPNTSSILVEFKMAA